MKPKLIELAEILKQKPEIKERLEGYFGPTVVNITPDYHDVLEYLGDRYYFSNYKLYFDEWGLDEVIAFSPGPLSDQSGETLNEIISLLKTVGMIS